MNRIIESCTVMETIRPELARLGLDFREANSQTIFTGLAPNGKITKPFFYLGKLGSDVSDGQQWTLFYLPEGDKNA